MRWRFHNIKVLFFLVNFSVEGQRNGQSEWKKCEHWIVNAKFTECWVWIKARSDVVTVFQSFIQSVCRCSLTSLLATVSSKVNLVGELFFLGNANETFMVLSLSLFHALFLLLSHMHTWLFVLAAMTMTSWPARPLFCLLCVIPELSL